MFILVNLAAGCGNDTIGFFYLVMTVNYLRIWFWLVCGKFARKKVLVIDQGIGLASILFYGDWYVEEDK
jgi:hypothetical protein